MTGTAPATSTPLVSVIVPNYNHAHSLPLTLPALLSQTYPRMEILFVDDCSTDDSVALARSMGLTTLSTARNSGAATARNLGVARSAGEVLVFLDSDVAIPPDTIARAVELLAADPAIGAYCGMLDEIPLVRDSLVQECRCLQAHYWRLSSEGAISVLGTALCAMRADVFAEMGPFHERLRETEELEYGERLSARYRVQFTSHIHGRHRDDHRLWPLLRKVFRRCRLRVPYYARRRRAARGFETAARIWAAGFVLLALLTAPLALLLGPIGVAVPIASLTAFLGCDAGMYLFVLRRRGIGFIAAFVALQVLVNLAIAAGAATGAAQWLASPAFRTLYDGAPRPAPVAA